MASDGEKLLGGPIFYETEQEPTPPPPMMPEERGAVLDNLEMSPRQALVLLDRVAKSLEENPDIAQIDQFGRILVAETEALQRLQRSYGELADGNGTENRFYGSPNAPMSQ